MTVARQGGMQFQDFSSFYWNSCEPSESTIANESGASNTFEKVFSFNIDSTDSQAPSTCLLQVQCLCAGRIELEILTAGAGAALVQYAKISGILSMSGDNTSVTLQNAEVKEYREFLGSASSNGPMQVSLFSNVDFGQNYPQILFLDGSQVVQTILVRCRIIGLVQNEGDDLNITLLNIWDAGQSPDVGPLPLPIRGVYVNGVNGETMPPLVKNYFITSDSTGIGSGTINLYLNPASSYKPGEVITVKDQGILNGGLNFIVTAYSSDTIDNQNHTAALNSSFDSITLMSDGVSNWCVVAINSTTAFGDGPGCQPVTVQ